MAKFKVGDKVRVIDFKENPPHWSRSGGMDKWKGKTVTLEKITRTNVTSNMEFSLREDRGEVFGHKWVWKSSDFEPVETRREFIVIHRSGNVMTAEHRVNREVIKSTKATCAPSDTFDFDTGAKLAFDRLMGREEPKPAPKPDPYAKYFTHSKDFESRSKFKIGDLVIRDGETKTVVGHERDSSNWVWTLDDRDSRPYPNLEHFLSPAPAPEQPKYYTGKVVMVDCEFPARKYLINHMFEFKDGRQVGSKMHGMSFDHDPYTSFEQIVSIHNASTWIEVK